MNIDLIAAPLPVEERAYAFLDLLVREETHLTEYWTKELPFICLRALEKRRHAQQLADIDPVRSRFLLYAISRMN